MLQLICHQLKLFFFKRLDVRIRIRSFYEKDVSPYLLAVEPFKLHVESATLLSGLLEFKSFFFNLLEISVLIHEEESFERYQSYV